MLKVKVVKVFRLSRSLKFGHKIPNPLLPSHSPRPHSHFPLALPPTYLWDAIRPLCLWPYPRPRGRGASGAFNWWTIYPIGLFEPTVVRNVLSLCHFPVDIEPIQGKGGVLVNDTLGLGSEGSNRLIVPPFLQITLTVKLSTWKYILQVSLGKV